jgi:hypothetical protein
MVKSFVKVTDPYVQVKVKVFESVVILSKAPFSSVSFPVLELNVPILPLLQENVPVV